MYTLHPTKSPGFTIVELLIVVVVIAILAAITIVSYTGITNRANGASAYNTAISLQKKVESYVTSSSAANYPTSLSSLTAGGNAWTAPASLWTEGSTVNGTVSSTSSDNAQYIVCGRSTTGTTAPTAANLLSGTNTVPTGARVAYWNYTASTPGISYIELGSGNSNVTVNSSTYNVTCTNPTS